MHVFVKPTQRFLSGHVCGGHQLVDPAIVDPGDLPQDPLGRGPTASA